MDYKQISKDVVLTEANELINFTKNIDESIVEAIDLIYTIKGKLIVMGVGKSGLVGSKIAATLASTGTSSFFIHPTEAMHGDLGMIGQDDAVLAISYSGESQELIDTLPHLKRFEIPLLSMSSNLDSTLAQNSKVALSIKIEKEACPLNIAPTSSTTLTMALGDALAVCLMHKRGFKKEDFASFHPGGSLGKRLFLKAKDLMRVDNLPIVESNSKLKDAIVIMSEGRLGSVLVVDKGFLVGLLSDGDIRRALLNNNFSLDNSVLDYCSKTPITIDNSNILAHDALKLIEHKKIQMLIIKNNLNKIEGVLHIHDLVEAGIK